MSTSPNLAITHATEAQSQKVTTLNTAIDKLDLALTDIHTEAMADSDQTLTAAEFRENMLFVTTGAHTANRTLNVPDSITRFFMVRDDTTGAFTTTVKTTSGTGVTIAVADKGTAFIFYSDGTDVTLVIRGENGKLSYSGYAIGSGSSQFGSSQTLMRIPVQQDITFPANFEGAFGSLATATTASTTFDVRTETSAGGSPTSIGSIVFGVADTDATFTTTSGTAKSVTAGLMLIVRAPGTQDTTADELGFMLLASKD